MSRKHYPSDISVEQFERIRGHNNVNPSLILLRLPEQDLSSTPYQQ
jgi:hypothetical protein